MRVNSRNAAREALTVDQAGSVWSREMDVNPSADAVTQTRKATPTDAEARALAGLCEVEDPCMSGNSTRENWEVLPTLDTKV